MNSIKSLTILFILFFASSIYAQKVMYKGKFYTIVNSKIFHRGYNVDGKLTDGAVDSIKVVGKELYNEKGKLKTEYKKRHIRQRYTLPEEFWTKNNVVASTEVTVDNPDISSQPLPSKNPNLIAAAAVLVSVQTSDSLQVKKVDQEIVETAKEEKQGIVKGVQSNEAVKVEKEKSDRLDEETKKQQAALEKRESAKEKAVKTEKKEQTKKATEQTKNASQSKSTTKKTTQNKKETKNQQAASEKRKTEKQKEVKTEKKEKTKKVTKQTENVSQSKSTTKKTTSKSAKKQKTGKQKMKISPTEAAAGVLIIKSLKGKKAPKKTIYQLLFGKC